MRLLLVPTPFSLPVRRSVATVSADSLLLAWLGACLMDHDRKPADTTEVFAP
jgi:hypothetical protein